MEAAIHYGLEGLSRLPGPVHLAAGFFDGMHCGHAAVLAAAAECAAKGGAELVALTFEPHPMAFLRPQDAPALLTRLAHKAVLAGRLGVRHLLVLAFDETMARQTPDAFIQSLHTAGPVLQGITVGEGWRFGHQRRGDVALLKQAGGSLGFTAQGIAPVLHEGEPVSSTRVRKAVEAGDFTLAAALLGRPWGLMGTVIQGRQLGRRLGFPTANLDIAGLQMPPPGVYAVQAFHAGREYHGVANAGHRPTVDGTSRAWHVEAHLFDYSGDLYGQPLELVFRNFLRGELRFDSLDALQTQIAVDSQAARQALEG